MVVLCSDARLERVRGRVVGGRRRGPDIHLGGERSERRSGGCKEGASVPPFEALREGIGAVSANSRPDGQIHPARAARGRAAGSRGRGRPGARDRGRGRARGRHRRSGHTDARAHRGLRAAGARAATAGRAGALGAARPDRPRGSGAARACGAAGRRGGRGRRARTGGGGPAPGAARALGALHHLRPGEHRLRRRPLLGFLGLCSLGVAGVEPAPRLGALSRRTRPQAQRAPDARAVARAIGGGEPQPHGDGPPGSQPAPHRPARARADRRSLTGIGRPGRTLLRTVCTL